MCNTWGTHGFSLGPLLLNAYSCPWWISYIPGISKTGGSPLQLKPHIHSCAGLPGLSPGPRLLHIAWHHWRYISGAMVQASMIQYSCILHPCVPVQHSVTASIIPILLPAEDGIWPPRNTATVASEGLRGWTRESNSLGLGSQQRDPGSC